MFTNDDSIPNLRSMRIFAMAAALSLILWIYHLLCLTIARRQGGSSLGMGGNMKRGCILSATCFYPTSCAFWMWPVFMSITAGYPNNYLCGIKTVLLFAGSSGLGTLTQIHFGWPWKISLGNYFKLIVCVGRLPCLIILHEPGVSSLRFWIEWFGP